MGVTLGSLICLNVPISSLGKRHSRDWFQSPRCGWIKGAITTIIRQAPGPELNVREQGGGAPANNYVVYRFAVIHGIPSCRQYRVIAPKSRSLTARGTRFSITNCPPPQDGFRAGTLPPGRYSISCPRPGCIAGIRCPVGNKIFLH